MTVTHVVVGRQSDVLPLSRRHAIVHKHWECVVRHRKGRNERERHNRGKGLEHGEKDVRGSSKGCLMLSALPPCAIYAPRAMILDLKPSVARQRRGGPGAVMAQGRWLKACVAM